MKKIQFAITVQLSEVIASLRGAHSLRSVQAPATKQSLRLLRSLRSLAMTTRRCIPRAELLQFALTLLFLFLLGSQPFGGAIAAEDGTPNHHLSLGVAASSEDTLAAQTLFDRSSTAFKDNKIEEAVSLLKNCIRLNPQYAEAYYRLGFILAGMGKFQDAVNFFKYATEINPAYTAAYINLGSSLGQLKQYDEALAALSKALELDKNNPKIYYNIGLIYSLSNQKALAEEYFTKAKELSKN